MPALDAVLAPFGEERQAVLILHLFADHGMFIYGSALGEKRFKQSLQIMQRVEAGLSRKLDAASDAHGQRYGIDPFPGSPSLR